MNEAKAEPSLPLPFREELVANILHVIKHVKHIAGAERRHQDAV